MTSLRPFAFAVAFAAPVACRSAAPGPAQPASVSGTYFVQLGSDTLAADQYTMTAERIEGTLVTHLPRTVVTRYVITRDPATGRALQIEHNSRLPDGSLLPGNAQGSLRQTTIAFAGDSAVTRIQRDTVATIRVAAPNAFPYINYSIATFQLPVSALRAAGSDSASMAIYTGGRVTTPMTVRRVASNQYRVLIGGYGYQVTTDGAGIVQSVDGRGTTQQFVATRAMSAAPAAATLAQGWAAREAGARQAALSVRDTTRATLGSAELWIDYGRPLARGRRVWGPNGVLNDTLWRTGANAATQFRTNAPVTIGGRQVPPGTYTLWTLAVPGRYQLIVNKQTGQWGTVYDPKQDLVRIPLEARTLAAPVEQFTIAITPSGPSAGVLRLRWDTTELSVPISTP